MHVLHVLLMVKNIYCIGCGEDISIKSSDHKNLLLFSQRRITHGIDQFQNSEVHVSSAQDVSHCLSKSRGLKVNAEI